MSKKHRRISLGKRIKIETLLNEDKSKTYIAKKLNRSRSTISKGINKWFVGGQGKYDAKIADWCAKDDYTSKRNLDKISSYKKLRFYVFKGLLSQWTPEQIAGKLKLDFPNNPIMSISHESIYTQPQARLNKKLMKLIVRKNINKNP